MTKKEERFCEEYVKDYNCVQAYIRVYGVSQATAEGIAYRVLKRPHCKEYIKRLQDDRYEAFIIDDRKILEELAHIAFDEKGYKKDKLAALSLLQKQLGLTTNKVELSTDNVIKVTIDD